MQLHSHSYGGMAGSVTGGCSWWDNWLGGWWDVVGGMAGSVAGGM